MKKTTNTKKSLDTFCFTYGFVSSLGDLTCSKMGISIHCSSKSKLGSSIKSATKKFEKHMEEFFNQSDEDDFDSCYNPNPFQFDYFISDVNRLEHNFINESPKKKINEIDWHYEIRNFLEQFSGYDELSSHILSSEPKIFTEDFSSILDQYFESSLDVFCDEVLPHTYIESSIQLKPTFTKYVLKNIPNPDLEDSPPITVQ